jgi:hypothetical protein
MCCVDCVAATLRWCSLVPIMSQNPRKCDPRSDGTCETSACGAMPLWTAIMVWPKPRGCAAGHLVGPAGSSFQVLRASEASVTRGGGNVRPWHLCNPYGKPCTASSACCKANVVCCIRLVRHVMPRQGQQYFCTVRCRPPAGYCGSRLAFVVAWLNKGEKPPQINTGAHRPSSVKVMSMILAPMPHGAAGSSWLITAFHTHQ